jgi:glycosyltransferase involved in cell wall biosynthesis
LKSVFAQSYQNLEIIVVDDGSTDDTRSVIDEYLGDIHYIYQENQGLSAARNTGMKHCTGEYIQFLDSDDLLEKNAIQARVDLLERRKDACIAVCPVEVFRDTEAGGSPVVTERRLLHTNNLDVHLCFMNIALPHAFLCRREVVERTGHFDSSLRACEDWDYWLRALGCGYVPIFCREGKVYYRRHGSSMTSNVENQYIHEAIVYTRLYRRLFLDDNFPVRNRLAGILAFLSGLSITLFKLTHIGHEDMIPSLWDIFYDSFDNTAVHTLKTPAGWDITTKMYYYVLLDIVNRESFLKSPRELPESLQNMRRADDIKMYLSSAITALRAPHSMRTEKRRLVKFLVKKVLKMNEKYYKWIEYDLN